nr:MAG TPA: hypothetical protein [Caudoviricetes sp.]
MLIVKKMRCENENYQDSRTMLIGNSRRVNEC